MSVRSISRARFESWGRVGAPHRDFVLGHRPVLDGLRGVAIIAVLAVHTNHLFGWSVLKGGSIGVDIFFVLSGFLITSILLSEWNATGNISLKHFYLRRCLRLFPALLLMIALVHLLSDSLFLPQEAELTRKASPLALAYVTDFAIAFAPNIQLGGLRHTWSLAMEEQFYLLWPPLLIVLLRIGVSKKSLILITLSLALVSALHRAALFNLGASAVRTYYGFDTRADALLIGCVAGMAVTWGLVSGMPSLTTPAIFLLSFLLVGSDYASPFLHNGGFTLLAAAAAVVVVNVVVAETDRSRRVLESAGLVWIGRISYGVYLWHYPIFKSLGNLKAPWPIKLLIGLVATFALASASFYLLEGPLLRLKRRFAWKESLIS